MTINAVKNALESFGNRSDQMKERISELEDRNLEMIQVDYAKASDWITTNCKILKEMGILDHLTCLLRNLYTGQEAILRTRHGTMDWLKIGKGLRQGCILSLCLFNLNAVQSTSCEMPGWMNHKLESRFPGEISIPQICRWHYPNGRNWRGSKEPLDEGERGEW